MKKCIYFHKEKITETMTQQTCRNIDSHQYGADFCLPDECKDYEGNDE